MAASRKGIGSFRRSYAAQLNSCHFQEKRINPLHLIISTRDACQLKKSNDDDTFVCAVYVKREGYAEDEEVVTSPFSPSPSSSMSLTSSNADTPIRNRSNLGQATPTTNCVFTEDIVVCVWAKDDIDSSATDMNRSISIDGDSSDDEVLDDDDSLIQLKCTKEFLTHYNLLHTDVVFIRAIEVFPLQKAIFSVNDEDCYQWLQQGKFAAGLLMEICNHFFLVKQSDIILAPFPNVFLNDENFHRSWYFNIKTIACTPFQMGLITASTEIIFYFEKAISRLPSDHRHLSGSHLDQYVELQGTRFISDFCRSMSDESNEENGLFGKPDEKKTFNNFFLSSAFVIQQKIHWKKVLHHDSNFERLDLTTVLGMPMKMLRQYGILDGTIMKIALCPGDIFGENKLEEAQAFLKNEKPKQKFVKVQCLSKRLAESDVVFISSMLLFNLQKRPPLVKSPLLLIEKPTSNQSDSDLSSGPKFSRSISTVVPFAIDVDITIVNSPSYTPKANHVESLNKYFQIPRLLSVGDVFAVSSTDDPEFWQESKVDTGVRKPVVFFKISAMSPRQPDVFAYRVDVNNSILRQISSDHSYVPLSASKYLSACDAVYGQSIVCPGLETYVTMLETLLIPHLNHKYDGSTLVELTPSVLLSGPKGCGKNIVVYTVARRLYMHVMEVNCHDLSGDTAGASEARIKSLFLAASKYTPCILLLRHVEVIGKERDGTTEDPRTISAFNRSVRQLALQAQLYPLILIGTTNNSKSMSDEMIPAFLHEVTMEAPSEFDRGNILRGLLDGHAISPDLSISHLAQRTAGFVLGDMLTLTLQALRQAYEKVLKICRSDGGEVSLQEEEDIVNAGIVVEQCDLDAALEEMQASHSDSIGAPKIPSVKWNDIGGLADVKSEILDTIQLPLQHPELLAAGLRRSGVLLYGPPGTGKTLLAKAVATECSLNFLSVKGPELINMYVGQSEENVREVFKRARSASPCVIFFDELDSLAPNRGRSGDSGGVMDRVVSQLLAELDGLHESHEVFIIGATNRVDLLDPALLRPGRFDKLLYLGISKDKKAQLSILKALTRKFKLCPSLSLKDVAEKCPDNLSGADLYALCADAMLNAMRRRIMLLDSEEETEEGEVVVEWQDFDEALANLTPSVSMEELAKYEEIRKSFET